MAPLWRLTRGLGLTSHPKDGMANSENKLHELVCDSLSHCYDSYTKGCCRGSNLGPSDPKAGVLTTRPSCSPNKNAILTWNIGIVTPSTWHWLMASCVSHLLSVSQNKPVLTKCDLVHLDKVLCFARVGKDCSCTWRSSKKQNVYGFFFSTSACICKIKK